MGAVDDAEDDDAPHFHFLKKARIEAADSGKIRAVLAECWRALSVNVSDGNNKRRNQGQQSSSTITPPPKELS